MISAYLEALLVDLEHADVAYSLFDAWKALGGNPQLTTTDKTALVYYIKTSVTVDKKEETDEQS